MDTPHWPQEMVVKAIEADTVVVTNSTRMGGGVESRKQARPQKEEAINCPRCNSINTKFCYYNNYSLTQPRYFCKTCRRYWTEGGSLRNIPVGGGCRKNNKTRSASASNKNLPLPPDLLITPPTFSHTPQTQNPKSNTNNINLQGQDLNLSFTTPDFRKISELVQQNNNNSSNSMSASASSSSSTTTTITTTASTSHQLSALELLTGITSSTSTTSFTSFMPMPVVPAADPNSVYTCGFPLQDFKPTLNFSLENGYHPSLHNNVQTGRLLFPFEDLNLKQVSGPTNTMDQKQQGDHSTHGYWTGMLGGGSW